MRDISIEEKYRQQYAQFGRMNDILYRLPVLFSTLIGGLWFFAFSFADQDKGISLIVLIFSGCLSVLFIGVTHRFRLAFESYINNINEMAGEWQIILKHSKSPSIITLIEWTLLLAALLSLARGIYLVVSGGDVYPPSFGIPETSRKL